MADKRRISAKETKGICAEEWGTNLENTKEIVAEFEGRMNTEVRRQERLDMAGKKDLGGKSGQESIWQKYYIDKTMENLGMSI